MAYSVVAEILNSGRAQMVDMVVNGRSFIITTFQTGSAGADPEDPSVALTPDLSTTIATFPSPTFGPAQIGAATENLSSFQATIPVVLGPNDAVGPFSSILLIAMINYSPIPNDPLVGTTFAYALANLPYQTKLAGETRTYDLILNF